MGTLLQGENCIAAKYETTLVDDFIDLANRIITEADQELNPPDKGEDEVGAGERDTEGTENGKYALGEYADEFREISIKIYSYLKTRYPKLDEYVTEYRNTLIPERGNWITNNDNKYKLATFFGEIKYLFTTMSFREINEEKKRIEENQKVIEAIELFGKEAFKNTTDINEFFKKYTKYTNFPAWFNTEIAGKQFWKRGHHFYKIRTRDFKITDEVKFTDVWNNIIKFIEPTTNSGVSLFQFFSIFSPMMNETGGSFKLEFQTRLTKKPPVFIKDVGEIGLLDYTFRYNYEKEDKNRRADNLFKDEDFMNTHKDKNIDSFNKIEEMKNNGTLDKWKKKGKKYYPKDFSINPEVDKYIAQADFYKFRGRGYIQTTHRSAYRKLVEKIKNYPGTNNVIETHKTQWDSWTQGMPNGLDEENKKIYDKILTKSSNADWSELFSKTDYIVSGLAVKHFDSGYDDIEMTVDSAGKQDVLCSRRGSFYFVGRMIGGSEDYGRVLRGRIIQMVKQLVNDAKNKQN